MAACTIVFELQTSTNSNAKVELLVLKSYEKMGLLECSVDYMSSTSFLLNSTWDPRISQVDWHSVDLASLVNTIPQQPNHTLVCKASAGKSKIVALRGC
eukprot:695017-Pleurochrysis_carterae.AAC.1